MAYHILQIMKIITTSSNLSLNPDYQTVLKALGRMDTAGLLTRGQGHCISMSDVTQATLRQMGITSSIIEVQTAITHTESNRMFFIGFSGETDKDSIDTHAVVVTHTTTPMLIDLSIGHKLPKGWKGIVEQVVVEGDMLAMIKHPDVVISYQQKQSASLPLLHQRSIVDRITTDTHIFTQIKELRWLNYAGIALSAFAVLNTILNWWIIHK